MNDSNVLYEINIMMSQTGLYIHVLLTINYAYWSSRMPINICNTMYYCIVFTHIIMDYVLYRSYYV